MIAESQGEHQRRACCARPPTRMYSAVLPDNTIYWRAGSFTPATTWDDLTAQTNRTAATASGLILDLRSNTTPDDFAGALRVARFLSKGQPGLNFRQKRLHLASFRTSDVLQGSPMVIVLTNRETRGAAEILAASLQAQGALVMGGATRRQGGHFLRSAAGLRQRPPLRHGPRLSGRWHRSVGSPGDARCRDDDRCPGRGHGPRAD